MRDSAPYLVGLYNEEGRLDHVGFNSSFNLEEHIALRGIVEPSFPHLDLLAMRRGGRADGAPVVLRNGSR